MTSGEMIKRARERTGMSVPKASKMAGVAERAWYQLEADQNSPTLTTLDKIAASLGISTKDLVPEKEFAEKSL